MEVQETKAKTEQELKAQESSTPYNAVTAGKRAKILSLLGKNIQSSVVATAVGVSESYVSQLLSDENFAQEVTALRTQVLESYTERDASYDSIEDKLLVKLDSAVTYMTKPSEILAALKVVGNAPRRGIDPTQRSGAGVTNHNTVIHVELPAQLIASFKSNALGQVVEAEHTSLDGETTIQSLVTLQSHKVEKLLRAGDQSET